MSNTMLNPDARAIMTASTGETTERQPFTAQAQGIRFGSVLPSSDMPSGKGMPISSPIGAIITKTSINFTGREKCEIRPTVQGIVNT